MKTSLIFLRFQIFDMKLWNRLAGPLGNEEFVLHGRNSTFSYEEKHLKKITFSTF